MTTEKKQEIINRLFAEQCSCIICNNHEIRLFHERGVKDIYRLLKEEPDFLNGSFIADKVIGKAIDRYIFESKVLHDSVEFTPYAGICIISTQNK